MQDKVLPLSRTSITGLIILATIIFFSLIKLGFWQVSRYNEKLLLEENLTKKEAAIKVTTTNLNSNKILYKEALIEGSFLNESYFLIDNQMYNRKFGYKLLCPFIMNKEIILVDLGWIPAQSRDKKILQKISKDIFLHFNTTKNTILKGKFVETHANKLSKQGVEKIADIFRIQNLDITTIENLLNKKIHPYVFNLSKNSKHSFTIREHKQWLNPKKHLGYAIQWFCLALAFFLLCAINLYKHFKKCKTNNLITEN